MTVAESLKRFRKAFKLSQKDVAAVLGTSQQAYQAYESKSSPSAKVILKLAEVYNVTTDYLLGLSDDPRPVKIDEETLNLIQAMKAFQAKQGTVM